MEFRSLEVFVEVVRQGGFTAAASKVFLTQPSISRVIRQLEDTTGQVLLERNTREVVLTEAGRIVYHRALGLLGERARLRTELDDLAGLRRGSLSLGIPPLGGTLFVPLVRRFKQLYPLIDLHLFEKGSKATVESLLAGDLDLGTVLLPADTTTFEVIPLAKDHLALAVPHGSKWEGAAPLPLGALAGQPLILFPEEFALNDRVQAACQVAGFQPQIAGRSGQAQFLEGLVESGVGLALLPLSVLKRLTNVATRELAKPGIPWDTCLAHPRGGYVSHAARAFIELASMYPPG